MKSSTSSWNGKARTRSVSRWMPRSSSEPSASSIAREVERDKARRLQPVGEIERVGGEGEGLVGVRREQQDVLRIAVRGVGAGDDVGLLGAGRHPGRRAAALDVEDDRGDLGEIGEAYK